MGRQRIEMKKIGCPEKRIVTFSKRKSGVFKKGSELSTLCDAEAVIIVNSPAGKPFSFGQPSVQLVLDKFSSQYSSSPAEAAEDNIFVRIQESLSQQRLDGLIHQINAEGENLERLDEIISSKPSKIQATIAQMLGLEIDYPEEVREELLKRRSMMEKQKDELEFDAAKALLLLGNERKGEFDASDVIILLKD